MAEADAAASLSCDLADWLSWNVWGVIADDEMDAATQKQTVEAMLTEFHDLVLKVATVLIDSDAMSDAAEAGKAFTRMTGCHVASSAIARVPRQDMDADDPPAEEFADEAPIPDVPHANTHWMRWRGQFSGARPPPAGTYRTERRAPEPLAAPEQVRAGGRRLWLAARRARAPRAGRPRWQVPPAGVLHL